MKNLSETIHRTGHSDCPACKAGRLHQAAEWEKYHPHAKTGIIDGRHHGKVLTR